MTISKSLQETKKLANDFVNKLNSSEKSATVFGLKGNLGSGKTTFVKFVAEILGLEHTVSSPTFVIEKIYKLKNQKFNHLIHIDAYRLESGEELLALGWDKIILDSQNLIFIEWPENISSILPKDVKYIEFKFVDEKTREIAL